jgi:phasin family protein
MPTEFIDQWTKFTRAAFDAAKELGELNTKLVEGISQQQFELAQASVDLGVKGVQLVSEPRHYKDLIAGQTALAGEYSDRVLKIARKGNEVAAELRDEYAAWIEGKVREATAPLMKATGPVSGKKAA